MIVTYDDQLKLAGVSVTPWARLGLEKWFPNYHIVTQRATDAADMQHVPPIYVLGATNLPRLNTEQLVMTDEFASLAGHELAGFSFLTYKPVHLANKSMADRFLMNATSYITTYENKAWLRQKFGTRLPFPKYDIYASHSLTPSQIAYDELVTRTGLPFMLQHEQLSGGKGTLAVTSYADFQSALSSLPADGTIVCSERIAGATDVSVQACVTKHGVLQGPLQRQIIQNNTFCGVEIGTLQVSDEQTRTIRRIVATIGEALADDGFKGIFGVDLLVTADAVYMLEVNARMTGVTPLLTMLYNPSVDAPFDLLHVLELSSSDYKMQTATGDRSNEPMRGSLLYIQSHESTPKRLDRTIASGVYVSNPDGVRLLRQDSGFQADDPPEAVCIQQYASVGTNIRPGAKLAAVITRSGVLDDDGSLNQTAERLMSQIRGEIHFAVDAEIN